MNEWKPIATAPRDTDILVCGIEGMACAYVGTFGVIYPSGVYATYDGCGSVAFEIGEITHWCELPALPKE